MNVKYSISDSVNLPAGFTSRLHSTQNLALLSDISDDITSCCHATGHQGDLACGPCESFGRRQSLFTKRVNKVSY